MGVSRGAVSLIVNDLLAQKLIFEGATGETERGRKPTFLYIDSRRRAVVAADIRASETFLMLADLVGKPLTGVISFPTVSDPKQLIAKLAARIKRLLAEHPEIDGCEGIGVVVPGMVEHSTMRVLHAPTLGWRNVDVREPLAAATGLPVQIENSGRACALAQMWALRGDLAIDHRRSRVYVSVSDGVGVGVIMNGEVLRGRHNIAGEFGHVPLSLDGPKCSCGAHGCWEAYISNRATLARYFGRAGEHGRARRREASSVHRRGPDHPCPRQRRESRRRHRSDSPLPRTRAGVGDQRARSGTRLRRRRDHPRVGSDRGHGAHRARRARAHVGSRRNRDTPGRRGRISALARRRRAGGRAGIRSTRRRREGGPAKAGHYMETHGYSGFGAASTCIVRDTASRKGRTRSVDPRNAPTRYLHYGRIILDAATPPLRFATNEMETGLICLRGSATVRVDDAGLHADALRRDLRPSRRHD